MVLNPTRLLICAWTLSISFTTFSASADESAYDAPASDIPPVVEINRPESSIVEGLVLIQGHALTGVTSIGVKIDQGAEQPALESEEWSYHLDTFTLTNGKHVIQAIAHDASGNEFESQPISISVANGDEHPLGVVQIDQTEKLEAGIHVRDVSFY